MILLIINFVAEEGVNHFVLFDVAFFENKSEEDYLRLLQSTMHKLIPCLDVNFLNLSKDNIGIVTTLYNQWVKSYMRNIEVRTADHHTLLCNLKQTNAQVSFSADLQLHFFYVGNCSSQKQ